MIKALLGATFGGLAILAFAWATLVFIQPVHAGEMRCGKASYYGTESGHRTASGDYFNGSSMTAAMPSRHHLGERYRVHYQGRSVIVRINDTGGFAKYGRIVDLSKAAAKRLGLIRTGVGRVCLERLS